MLIDFPNLRHLLAFKEVGETNSISRAAERIHLSQPAVTQAIAGLEKNLGVTLFDRYSKGMFLTDQGRKFLGRVTRIFDLLASGLKGEGDAQIPNAHNVTASQLRALIGVNETGSFSRAARRIGISQPSVHRAARDLEMLVGAKLFVTTRNGVELTAFAQKFAMNVNLAADELSQAFDEIELARGLDRTKIVVGSMPLSRSMIIPAAINALLEQTPSAQVRSIEGPFDELLRGLRYGEIDFLIGALRDPNPSDDTVQEHLFDDQLSIVVSANHPLTSRPSLTLEDTFEFPWIAPPKNTPTGQYLFDHADIAEREQSPVGIVSSSITLIRGLLKLGPYVTILSRHQVEAEAEQGFIVPLDIRLPQSARPIGLTFRRDWHATPTQQKFVDYIRKTSAHLKLHL